MVEEKKKKRKISEDKKKFVCDICGKKCANPSALRMHKKWKHDDTPANAPKSDDKSFRENEGGGKEDDGWVPF